MAHKSDDTIIGSIATIRYGSRKPCTIEVMRTKSGEVVLRTLDGSGVTTLAAVLTATQIDELVRLLQSAREP